MVSFSAIHTDDANFVVVRDQELRFTVRDSIDYYQIKVSVFNDDKKTDLIGETWVDLKEVILPGGGQNDLWHNLSCKGKYAGEIRIEMTYYDTRPKQEKPVEAVRPTLNNNQGESGNGRESLSGPRHTKASPKRRPLPSNPSTANSSPANLPEQYQTPPRAHQHPQAYIPTQSPLQTVEYNTPPSQRYPQLPQTSGQSPAADRNHGPSQAVMVVTPVPRPLQNDRYEIYDPAENQEYIPGNILGRLDDALAYPMDEAQPRHRPRQQEAYESTYDPNGPAVAPDGPPPPPPAHRSNHGSPAVSHQNSYNSNYSTPPSNVVRSSAAREEKYRHPMPAYPQNETYQAYSPPKAQETHELYSDKVDYYQPPRQKHQSYDEKSHPEYESMQPSVEDAPPSPGPGRASVDHYTTPYTPDYDIRRYENVPSPAPLNISGRGSATSGRQSISSGQNHGYHNGQPTTGSSMPYQDKSRMQSESSSRTSFSQHPRHSQQRPQSRDHGLNTSGGYIPPVPATLVAGMNPAIAQEVSDRIYDDNTRNYDQSLVSQGPGRHQEQIDPPQYRQNHSHMRSRSDAPAAFVPAPAYAPPPATYDGRRTHVAYESYTPVVNPRAISPDTRIQRKSVSPAPVVEEPRRLSGVPFGPDAYNALNPNVTPAKSAEPAYSTPITTEIDPEAKIIMHDGREIDPSDHLPQHSWAPEPEVKAPKPKSEVPAVRERQSPSGAQPMPPSGRRPLRLAQGRSQPMSTSSSPAYMSGAISDPSTPVPAQGRTRLQKKSDRSSMALAPQSSPLAPISAYQDNSHATRSLPRAHTLDFAGENERYKHYDSNNGSPGYRNSAGPPIPDKVPMIGYAPPTVEPAESAWALLEEMKTIDLGSGRARRKGQSYALV